ncbi:MAG: hypothetical protein ACREPP_09305 [Rhodanobacteraceae bacterium]
MTEIISAMLHVMMATLAYACFYVFESFKKPSWRSFSLARGYALDIFGKPFSEVLSSSLTLQTGFIPVC